MDRLILAILVGFVTLTSGKNIIAVIINANEILLCKSVFITICVHLYSFCGHASKRYVSGIYLNVFLTISNICSDIYLAMRSNQGSKHIIYPLGLSDVGKNILQHTLNPAIKQ